MQQPKKFKTQRQENPGENDAFVESVSNKFKSLALLICGYCPEQCNYKRKLCMKYRLKKVAQTRHHSSNKCNKQKLVENINYVTTRDDSSN